MYHTINLNNPYLVKHQEISGTINEKEMSLVRKKKLGIIPGEITM